MIIWLNGAFGSGKTTVAQELHRRLPDSFVYDPENVGFFLRKNTPPQCDRPDFQDIPLWRSFNCETLKMIAEAYPGTVIVPMTLVNRQYYGEIIDRLQSGGVKVSHFILYAGRETILRRLQKRNLRFNIRRREKFAIDAIPRCLDFFDHEVTEIRLPTDTMTVDQVVEAVAEKSGLTLEPDTRGPVKKVFHRLGILLKHIR